MITPRRSAAVLLALLIFAAWFALLRPTGLGGPATFIIINGDSMEPTYSHGDLVVLHKAPSYKTGDIVAYPMQTAFDTGRLVIHRVIGADADGFITQGDNRETADPWRATDENVRGAAWAHIPTVGNYIAWLQQPSRLGALAAGIVLLGCIGQAETVRRRRHGMKRPFSTAGSGRQGGGAMGNYQPGLVTLAAAGGVLALAFLGLGLLAFRSDTHGASQVAQATYSETGSFEYAIVMEPSTLYPDGILRSPVAPADGEPAEAPVGGDGSDGGTAAPAPAPAFTALAREARVTFDYLFEGTGEVVLGGMVAADLVIRPEGGEWTRTATILAARPFEGTSLTQVLTVDLVAAGTLIAQIEEETGLSGGSYEIAVVARVSGAGEQAGEPIETAFESTFALAYDRTLITPPAQLTTTVEATSTETVATAKTLSLGFWSPSVTTARSVATVGFITALGAVLVLGGYVALGLWSNEQARIRARYGSRMVDVQAGETERVEDSIRVASIRDLARVAERCGSVILHTPSASGHRYFVRDGEDTYEYVSPAGPSGMAAPGANVADTPGSAGGAR